MNISERIQDTSNLYSLDIETEPISNASDAWEKKHALIPHLSRITKIGLVSFDESVQLVFNSVDELRNYLEGELSGNYRLIGHNFKFDLKHLHFKGYSIPLDKWYGCTQILANCKAIKLPQSYLDWYESARQIENAKLSGKKHRKARGLSLKTLAPYHLGIKPFWEDPNNHNDDTYVLKDTLYTMQLFKELLSTVDDTEYNFYKDKHFPWAKELYKAELRGVKLDMGKIEEKEQYYSEMVEAYSEELKSAWSDIHREYTIRKIEAIKNKYNNMCKAQLDKGKDPDKTRANYNKLLTNALQRTRDKGDIYLNLASSDQLKWALNYRGYNIFNFAGKESTEKEVLQRLSKKHSDIKALLNYRKYQKLLTTYIPSYKELSIDGRIHASFNTTGARTGRLSSSFPNLQNQPAEVRDCFIADPDHTFVIRDYSAIEPRVLAYFSEDEALLRCFNGGEDFHGMTAKVIFNYIDCPSYELKVKYPDERGVAKTCGLAILYGAGANRLHRTLYEAGFTDYDVNDCKRIVKDIRKLYAGVWDFKKYLDGRLEAGDIIYNILGRPIYFDNVDDIYMKGLNRLIQGSASDIVQDAFMNVNKAVEPFGAQCLITVHDEILMQAPDKSLDKCIELKENVMKNNVILKLDSGETIDLLIEGEESKVWVK